MKNKILTVAFTVFAMFGGAYAQTSWLDRPLYDWNRSSVVPRAPRATGNNPDSSLCRNTVRNPESIADRALTRAGWSLFGGAQIYGPMMLINGMASVDGMCRPVQFNVFVFVRDRFAGTLSPVPMDSRTDGALINAVFVGPSDITADFARYTSFDALCCPSQTSTVSYRVSGARARAENVSTAETCQKQGEQDMPGQSSLQGTVSYRERMALPRDAEIKVKLVDATRGTLLGAVISEDTFRANGRQVPFQYELRYNARQIRSNNKYVVQAEIYSDGRLMFKTDRDYPVLTRGNPATNVPLILVRATDDDDADPDDPSTVTGKEISLSKFGTGSLEIEGRSDKFIVRVQVKVEKDGKARVTLTPIGAAITFSGNLISDDNSTLKIAVTSSGSADASGEIEVKYSGNRLSSVSTRNLVLDGQKASISF